jgi:hypothetical protein
LNLPQERDLPKNHSHSKLHRSSSIVKPDISTWQRLGHFYLALTGVKAGVKAKCQGKGVKAKVSRQRCQSKVSRKSRVTGGEFERSSGILVRAKRSRF